MNKYEIKHIGLSQPIFTYSIGDYQNSFYIGQEFDDILNHGQLKKVIAIQDNMRVKGYMSIVLADQNGTEKEFINVYNPSSVCGEIVSCDDI